MDTSSEISDLSSDDGARYKTKRILPSVPVPRHNVDILTSDLQETTRNIRAVDNMLDQYKDVSEHHSSAIDKLREDLSRTTTQLREERENRKSASTRSLRSSDLDQLSDSDRRSRRKRRKPTSPIRDYRRKPSDEEYTGYPPTRRVYGGRQRTSSVRFRDDLNESVHEMHQSLRDLTSNQVRMEDELNREVDRRKRSERDSRRSLRDLSSSIRQNQTATATLPTNSRVDQRLLKLEDEFQTKRKLREQKEDLGHLSTELKQALHHLQQPVIQQPAPDNSRWERLERERIQAENELKSTRRKLDQTEGSKSTLVNQVAELRGQLSRAEEEKLNYRKHLEVVKQEEEVNNRKKRRAVEESEDRVKLEKQIQELTAQLSRASGAGELGDMRRDLDKSERQRAQLSDHIEVLTKDLDNKEKHAAKLITQLRDFNERQQECEQQKNTMAAELEDALRRLRDVTREAQKYASELSSADNTHQDDVKRNEELKARAQEVVRQWKAKCKKLERELDRQQHTAKQAQGRVEQLIKENETVRNVTNNGSMTLENMKREMADILSIRAQQDEQITGRDLQINELRSTQASLETELQEAKRIMEHMDTELQNYQQRFYTLTEERNKLDDALSSTQAAQLMSQDQGKQLQRKLTEQENHTQQLIEQLRKAELQHQEVKNKAQDLKKSLNESRRNETVAKKDIDDLALQVKELKQSHISTVENLKQQLESTSQSYKQQLQAAQSQEEKTKNDFIRRIKRDQAEHEAEVEALKIQLSEERSSSKLLKRQGDKCQAEMDRLHQEINRLELEKTTLKQKYQRMRYDYEAKSATADEDIGRVRMLEDELNNMQETLSKSQRDQQNLLHSVGLEVQTVMELAAVDVTDKFEAASPLKNLSSDQRRWLSAVQGKLQWLRTNIRERQDRERRYKSDLRDALSSNSKDRNVLVSELGRQKQIADDLASKAEALDFLGRQKEVEVETLEEQVHNLTDQLETQREESFHQSFEREREKQQLLRDVDKLKESDQERTKIHQRYSRLQETVSALKQELNDATKSAKEKREDRMESDLHAARVASITPPRVRRNPVPESPPTRDSIHRSYPQTVQSNIPKIDYRTSNQMDNSDIDPPDLTTRDLTSHKRRDDFLSQRQRTNSGILRTKSATDHAGRDNRSTVRFSPSTYKRDIQSLRSQSDSVLSCGDSDHDSMLDSYSGKYEHRLSSSAKGDKTPPPLSLSDDEFRKKFIPRTPTLSDTDDY